MAHRIARAFRAAPGGERARPPTAWTGQACPCDRSAIRLKPVAPGTERPAAVPRALHMRQADPDGCRAMRHRPAAPGNDRRKKSRAHRVSRPDPCCARHAIHDQPNAGRTAYRKTILARRRHHGPRHLFGRDPRVLHAARPMRSAREIGSHRAFFGRRAARARHCARRVNPCVRRVPRPCVRHRLRSCARFVCRCAPCAS